MTKESLESTDANQKPAGESPAAKAMRLTEQIRGLLKSEFAEYGGGEAFLRWMRSEDDIEDDDLTGH